MPKKPDLAELIAACEEHPQTAGFARKLRRHVARMATLRRALDPDDTSTFSPASAESLQAELDRRSLEVQVVAHQAAAKLTEIGGT